MADPASLEEYGERFKAAYSTAGAGELTEASFPCPFCAEDEWYTVRLVDFGQPMRPHYCIGCGRSSRFVFTDLPDGVRAELVQCSGSAAPEWMQPTPRREDKPADGKHSEGYLVPPPPLKPPLRTPPSRPMPGVDP